MIAETIKTLRILSRPLRRQFWWPSPSQEKTDRPGVVLVSFDHLKEWEQKKLKVSLAHYRAIELIDDALPRDSVEEHGEKEPPWAGVYRALIMAIRSLTSFWRLLSKRTSLAQHLCESDDLARLHLRLMTGKCYVHIGTLHTKRLKVLKRIRGFVSGLEWRHYEVWVIDRQGRKAYLPSSIPLPEVPLEVQEIVEMARRRPLFVPHEATFHRRPKAEGVIRVMSYNLHSCIGLDGRVSIRRIAEVLHHYDPDFVALQELDCGCLRSQGRDQLEELKELWPSFGEFMPLVRMRGGQYGIGYLSRLPVVDYRAHLLPGADQLLPQEARGVQLISVETKDGLTLDIINTHLGLTPKERQAQLKALLKLSTQPGRAQVLTGDFNCKPSSREYRVITRSWHPTQKRPAKTWFGTFPLRHLDYCFVRGPLEVVKTYVPRDSLTRLASDHLPLITDLRWKGPVE